MGLDIRIPIGLLFAAYAVYRYRKEYAQALVASGTCMTGEVRG